MNGETMLTPEPVASERSWTSALQGQHPFCSFCLLAYRCLVWEKFEVCIWRDMGFISLNGSVVYNGSIRFSFCPWPLATRAWCLASTPNSDHNVLVIDLHPVSRACASESKCIQLCVCGLAPLRLWLCVLGSHVRSTCR